MNRTKIMLVATVAAFGTFAPGTFADHHDTAKQRINSVENVAKQRINSTTDVAKQRINVAPQTELAKQRINAPSTQG